MRIGGFTLSAASLALLAVQLMLGSAFAAKYLYQRWTSPCVWTRAAAVDPNLLVHGHYLILHLTVDGCQSTLPSAKDAAFPRKFDGTVKPGPYTVRQDTSSFRAELKVLNNALVAVRPEGQEFEGVEEATAGEEVEGIAGASCDQMQLDSLIHVYAFGPARNLSQLQPGQELWVEVTVPPQGPPRPLRLALKDNGVWQPLGKD